MHFEKIIHKDYIARLVFEDDGRSLLINEELAIKFLSTDFSKDNTIIKKRTRRKHVYNPETGQYDKFEDKDCWFKLFELDEYSKPRFVNKKEIARMEQSQKSLARILDDRLYDYFNCVVKVFNTIRSDFRNEQKKAGICTLRRNHGDDWQKQYEKAKTSRMFWQFLRDTFRHVNRDFIKKIQEMRKNNLTIPKTKITVFTPTTLQKVNWVIKLSKKQHVRANKSFLVNMPIIIDDDFFRAISV